MWHQSSRACGMNQSYHDWEGLKRVGLGYCRGQEGLTYKSWTWLILWPKGFGFIRVGLR